LGGANCFIVNLKQVWDDRVSCSVPRLLTTRIQLKTTYGATSLSPLDGRRPDLRRQPLAQVRDDVASRSVYRHLITTKLNKREVK
jgi:hypothetical protein